MLNLYRLLINVVCVFAPIILRIRIYKQKEDKNRYKEKLCIIKKKRLKGKLIWFHASSVGELLSIIPLLEKLQKIKEIKTILCTTNTLSSSKVFKKKIKSKKIIHQFLPLDTNVFTRKFLNHWLPDLVIFVESEIWPNFIFNIKNKMIPLVLLNARITIKTYSRWKKIPNFAKSIFNSFDMCLSQNNETEKYLNNIGVKKIKNLGNLKFSSSNSSSSEKFNKNILKIFQHKKIWCATSTHDGEEVFCAKTHIELKKKLRNIILIIIPRHIHRCDEIIKELNKMNLKIHLHRNISKFNRDTDVYLVDTFGETQKFFNISKAVFLGGSLMNHGGQNPIEPTRKGCTIYHGPHISNFKEVYSYLASYNISKKIDNINNLKKFLLKDLGLKEKGNKKLRKQIDSIGRLILKNIYLEIKKFVVIHK
jgi:3-deoxy-D-manno-octulosonic-acid transferase